MKVRCVRKCVRMEKKYKRKRKKYTNGHNTQICKRNEFKIV